MIYSRFTEIENFLTCSYWGGGGVGGVLCENTFCDLLLLVNTIQNEKISYLNYSIIGHPKYLQKTFLFQKQLDFIHLNYTFHL